MYIRVLASPVDCQEDPATLASLVFWSWQAKLEVKELLSIDVRAYQSR